MNFDVYEQKSWVWRVSTLPSSNSKNGTGRPIGINLEPTSDQDEVLDVKVKISKGRQATAEAFQN